MTQYYSVKQVCEAVGVNHRMMDYWLHKGYVPGVPPDQVNVGTGNPREMTVRVAFELAVLKALTDTGVKLGELTRRERLLLVRRGYVRRGSVVLVVDLANVRDRTCDRLGL